MSSDYDTFGSLNVKNVKIDQSGIILHDANDDGKTITMKVAGAFNAGNVDLTLPKVAGAMLSDQSALNGAKLSAGSVGTVSLSNGACTAAKLNINGAADISTNGALADEMLISDVNDANTVKKITLTNLKTLVGGSSLPSGTSAQILVNDGSAYASVAMSGDATIATTGAITLANDSVGSAQIENNAVTTVKIGNAQVTAAKLAVNSVAAAAVQAGAISTVKLGADCVTSAKLADQSEVVISNGGNETFISSADSTKRFRFTATDNVLKLEYSSNSGSAYSTVQTFTYP